VHPVVLAWEVSILRNWQQIVYGDDLPPAVGKIEAISPSDTAIKMVPQNAMTLLISHRSSFSRENGPTSCRKDKGPRHW
jgi:hypothetical protein